MNNKRFCTQCFLLVSWCTLLGLIGCPLPTVSSFLLLNPRCRPPWQGPSNIIILFMGLRGKRIRREKRKAWQDPTPPRLDTPYGPIRLTRPPRTCDLCLGRGHVRCTVCEGRGVTRATGSRKQNPVRVDRLLHSRWTSVEIYHGHRHHTILEVQGSVKKKKNVQVRMRNCCGEPNDFWIPLDELKDKLIWRMGWLTLEDIVRANGGPLLDARLCFRCKGGRILPCVDCDGQGEIPSYEPLYD